MSWGSPADSWSATSRPSSRRECPYTFCVITELAWPTEEHAACRSDLATLQIECAQLRHDLDILTAGGHP
jgi:hypothetical protein